MIQSEVEVLWIPAELKHEVETERLDTGTVTLPDGTPGHVRFRSKYAVTFVPDDFKLPILEHYPAEGVLPTGTGYYVTYRL